MVTWCVQIILLHTVALWQWQSGETWLGTVKCLGLSLDGAAASSQPQGEGELVENTGEKQLF